MIVSPAPAAFDSGNHCNLTHPNFINHGANTIICTCQISHPTVLIIQGGPPRKDTILPELPNQCCTVAIDPLLRELVIGVARLPQLYDRDGPSGRLIQTMLDELATAPVEHLHLPLPTDTRLRKITDVLTADPSNRTTIGEWAAYVAMSERTLFRLILRETGMSFGRWRQQFQIMLALERLAGGEPVQAVAFDLGYESASAFITMFKKALGQLPGKYLASRRSHAMPRGRDRNQGRPLHL